MWRHTSLSVRHCSVAAVRGGFTVEVIHIPVRGHPKVELLRSGGYTWDEIADCFLVSRETI